MNKIIVIGCGGAGKSTFLRKLSEKIGIPVYHLDKFFGIQDGYQHLKKNLIG